jgi:hypothetical protein
MEAKPEMRAHVEDMLQAAVPLSLSLCGDGGGGALAPAPAGAAAHLSFSPASSSPPARRHPRHGAAAAPLLCAMARSTNNRREWGQHERSARRGVRCIWGTQDANGTPRTLYRPPVRGEMRTGARRSVGRGVPSATSLKPTPTMTETVNGDNIYSQLQDCMQLQAVAASRTEPTRTSIAGAHGQGQSLFGY